MMNVTRWPPAVSLLLIPLAGAALIALNAFDADAGRHLPGDSGRISSVGADANGVRQSARSTTGDLISELDVIASVDGGQANVGGELEVEADADVVVTIRIRDPELPNHRGEAPSVRRVDLIFGEVTGTAADLTTDTNPTTRVVARFTADDWTQAGEVREMTHTLANVRLPGYIRVRGTNHGRARAAGRSARRRSVVGSMVLQQPRVH